MKRVEVETLPKLPAEGAVGVYCLGALVAEEAQRTGHADFARSIETALSSFLEKLPRDIQCQALRLSYEMALGGECPPAPKLRLVYSRD